MTKDEVSTLLAFTLSLFCVICVCPKCARVFCSLCSSCFLVHHYFVILTRFIKNNENTDMWMLYIPPKCVTDVSLQCLHPRFKYCTRFVFIKTWTFCLCVIWIASVLDKARQRAHGWSAHVSRCQRGKEVRSRLKSGYIWAGSCSNDVQIWQLFDHLCIPFQQWYLGFSKKRKRQAKKAWTN